MQNACSVEEAKKNPLTNEDWLSLYGSLKITYPFSWMDWNSNSWVDRGGKAFLLFVEVRVGQPAIGNLSGYTIYFGRSQALSDP